MSELITQSEKDFSVQLAELDKIAETCKKLMQTKSWGGYA